MQPEQSAVTTEPDLQPVTIQTAIEAFLTDLAAGHSPATVRTYRVALTRFKLYLSSQAQIDSALCPVGQLQTDWAVDCVRWISLGQPSDPAKVANSATSRSPKTTTATYVAGLGRFYRWCALERWLLLPSDEFERMSARFKELRGKVQRTILDKVPADEVIESLLRAAYAPPGSLVPPAATSLDPGEPPSLSAVKSGFRGNLTKLAEQDERRHRLIHLRNIALLETLKSSGARVSELTEMRRSDLDAANRRARVVGKGSKERWIYFSRAAWDTLQTYLQERTRLMNPATLESPRRGHGRLSEMANQPVFARHNRGAGWKAVQPMTPDAVRKMLWELVEQADLQVYITPHKFRHWFATRMLSATGDLAATQDLLGHANPATTRIYAQVSETSKQNLHRQVFD